MMDLDRHSVVDLTTVGRVSGRSHTIEIWFAQRESTIYMLSGGGDRCDWVRNLLTTPSVTVRVGSNHFSGSARLVTDSQEERVARGAVHDRYAARYGGDLNGSRENALPIAVDLVSSRGG
jgi:deazaflavin-dependent oxidoreductase (nitroreductase family)